MKNAGGELCQGRRRGEKRPHKNNNKNMMFTQKAQTTQLSQTETNFLFRWEGKFCFHLLLDPRNAMLNNYESDE